jgi:hypothetical protein
MRSELELEFFLGEWLLGGMLLAVFFWLALFSELLIEFSLYFDAILFDYRSNIINVKKSTINFAQALTFWIDIK